MHRSTRFERPSSGDTRTDLLFDHLFMALFFERTLYSSDILGFEGTHVIADVDAHTEDPGDHLPVVDPQFLRDLVDSDLPHQVALSRASTCLNGQSIRLDLQ